MDKLLALGWLALCDRAGVGVEEMEEVMRCGERKCLAEIQWFGEQDDPILVKMAEDRGWRLLEANGWRCPHHAPSPKQDDRHND